MICFLTYSLDLVPEPSHESLLPDLNQYIQQFYSISNPCPMFKFSMPSFYFMRTQNVDGSSMAHIFFTPYSNCSSLSVYSILANSGTLLTASLPMTVFSFIQIQQVVQSQLTSYVLYQSLPHLAKFNHVFIFLLCYMHCT